MIKIDWLKPKKSDKGAVVLHLNKQFNLLLWCKENLDEWMFMIKESVERNKLRRSCIVQNGIEHRINHQHQHQSVIDNGHCINSTTIDDGQLYENTAPYKNDCATQVSGKTNNHDDIVPVTHSNNITDHHHHHLRTKVSRSSLNDNNSDRKQRQVLGNQFSLLAHTCLFPLD